MVRTTGFFKGVKSFLTNKSSTVTTSEQKSVYTREGVAVTFTTEFSSSENKGDITLFSLESGFLPCQLSTSSCFENKAYVHYEPKKAQVTLGTNPDAKRLKTSIKLSIEQYAWMIRQLQEELSLGDLYKSSLMLGLTTMQQQESKSISKRFIRFVQQKRKPFVQQQCIFMLPKALLLQAAAYIPMTKPLPPPITSVQLHLLSHPPYRIVSDAYTSQLKRYAHLVQLCEHELLLDMVQSEPTPPSSFNDDSVEATRCHIQCADCLINTCDISTIQQSIKDPSVMFPVSYVQQYILSVAPKDNIRTSSAIQPQRRATAFDSVVRRQKPHAVSAFQYIPPDRSSSTSSVSSISQYSNIPEEEEGEEGEDLNVFPQKYGYVAVDDKHEEILVVFPGMATSSTHVLENASFVPVPWHEINNVEKKTQDSTAEPWVLDCALTAWHRCEMRVVTLLMRLCGTMPSHYKVVIMGYSLGGGKQHKGLPYKIEKTKILLFICIAVAALCASSLRSTQLLVDREMTVCAVHSPRVGNRVFLASLSDQGVKTIRITHCQDLMAHLPPRTTGLLHVGESSTVILTEKDIGHVLDDMTSNEIEDTLSKTFSFEEYSFITKVWDLDMKDSCCK